MARLSWFDFLERLQHDGVVRRLDPRTLAAVEELLAADFTPAELTAALASLLADNATKWQQVEARARAYVADQDAVLHGESVSPRAPPKGPPLELRLAPEPGPIGGVIAHKLEQLADSRSRLIGWILPGLLLVVVLGLALAAVSLFWFVDQAIETSSDAPQSDEALPAQIDPPQEKAPDPSTLAIAPTPEPSPSHHPGTVFLLALMFVSYALIVAGLRWLAAPRAQRKRAIELHDHDALDARGPRVIYNVASYPPFAVQAMDAAATLLARLPRVGHSFELDVNATLRATIAAGGRTTPVLAPRHAAQELTILVDRERGDHPWLRGVEWVLQRWAQDGLRFVRVDFRHQPDSLWIHPDRRETSLDALGRRFEGTPLLMFARATRLREFSGGHGWLRHLGPWPVRAIVDLDPRDDPALLREERDARRALARVGLKQFPFTAAGLVAMAHHIGSGGVLRASPPAESLRAAAAIEPELKAWASCLACVPDPSWAQLEVFRREFFAAELPDPRYVQRLLDYIAPALDGGVPDDPVTADGTRINLSRPKLRHHREQLRKLDDHGRWRDLEVRASDVILRQLRGTDPSARADRQLRDFKVAIHEAVLAERDPERGDPGAHLQVFVGNEMEEDLRRWLVDEKSRRGANTPEWLTRLESAIDGNDLQIAHMGQWLLPRGLREIVPDSLTLAGLSWLGLGAWLQLGWLAVTGGASLGIGVVWWFTRRRRPTPAEHLVTDDADPSPFPNPTAVADFFASVRRPPPTPDQLGSITSPPTGTSLGVIEVALADIAPMRFIGLTGGEFTIGSLHDEPGRWEDEGPQHRVHVSPLLVAEHVVTQAQWRAVMGNDPIDPDLGIGDDLPVNNITWFETIEFLNRLSAHEKLTPCYINVGPGKWRWDRMADGYRLPTEAEWEFAARAGTTTEYNFDDDQARLDDHAWYDGNSQNHIHPVGRLRPVSGRVIRVI